MGKRWKLVGLEIMLCCTIILYLLDGGHILNAIANEKTGTQKEMSFLVFHLKLVLGNA